MKRPTRYRDAKRKLLLVRDATLTPQQRMKVAAGQMVSARAVFMAGMAARGFSRAEALRAWRQATPRAK